MNKSAGKFRWFSLVSALIKNDRKRMAAREFEFNGLAVIFDAVHDGGQILSP